MNFSGFSVLRGAKSPCEDVDDVGRRGDWTALIMTHHNTVNKAPHLSSTVPAYRLIRLFNKKDQAVSQLWLRTPDMICWSF